MTEAIEAAIRNEGGQVLATLIRLTRSFDLAEDALQDATLVALEKWAETGVPRNPAAWLTHVARNKALDRLRRDANRLTKEAEAVRLLDHPGEEPDGTDTLRLLFTCCHPALSPEARVALTLRTLCGLSTREIARAFLQAEATIGQRISRAKRKIEIARIPYRVPSDADLPDRLAAVLQVLYVTFTAGYTAYEGPSDSRVELGEEAIRVTRLLADLMPDEPEVWGLLALMLATWARRHTRLDLSGNTVLLADQDRSRWDVAAIAEADNLLQDVLRPGTVGIYQLQAAIACVHALALSEDATDWPQIALLYRRLAAVSPTMVVLVNQSVAEAKVHGPSAGLAVLGSVAGDGQAEGWHLYWSTKGTFLEQLGEGDMARACFRRSLACHPNETDRRFLEGRLAALERPG